MLTPLFTFGCFKQNMTSWRVEKAIIVRQDIVSILEISKSLADTEANNQTYQINEKKKNLCNIEILLNNFPGNVSLLK